MILQETYYSVGGGFVLTEAELAGGGPAIASPALPHPFANAAELLERCRETRRSIAALMRANELARTDAASLDRGLARLWSVMDDTIERGLRTPGTLPGGLNVRRRAHAIHAALKAEHGRNLAVLHSVTDWLSVYAMAVNEENAAGGQVVTAPTNGAAGVVPAVLRFWLDRYPEPRGPGCPTSF